MGATAELWVAFSDTFMCAAGFLFASVASFLKKAVPFRWKMACFDLAATAWEVCVAASFSARLKLVAAGDPLCEGWEAAEVRLHTGRRARIYVDRDQPHAAVVTLFWRSAPEKTMGDLRSALSGVPRAVIRGALICDWLPGEAWELGGAPEIKTPVSFSVELDFTAGTAQLTHTKTGGGVCEHPSKRAHLGDASIEGLLSSLVGRRATCS